MSNDTPPSRTLGKDAVLRDQEVEAFLRAHPDFLVRHPHLVEVLTPPESKRGDGVVDMQQFMLHRLQQKTRDDRSRLEELVTSLRDNQSVLQQVHRAVVALVKARTLEQPIEVVSYELPVIFGVDVVRLAVESSFYGSYPTLYPEDQYSGIAFIPEGTAIALFEADGVRSAILYPDTRGQRIEGFEHIFADCSGLVQSCAMLPMGLERAQKFAILAFGTRNAGHYHSAQGIDLLTFLAQVTETCLDVCLHEAGEAI
jgi:uncharacterized protein YigA (DUF484 family)